MSTDYAALQTEAQRWAAFVDEWGLPTTKDYLRARWEQHVQRANNGDLVAGVWHNGYGSRPYWSLDRGFDLTSWGLGVTVSADVWDRRQFATLHVGPLSLSLTRSETGV